MEVKIDSKSYWATGQVVSSSYQQWPTQLRTTGQQLREDRAPFPLWAPTDVSGGLGRKYSKSDENTYWFGSCDTAWGRVLLPPRVKQCGVNGADLDDASVLVAYIQHKGDNYALFWDDTGDKAVCAVWDDANAYWDQTGVIETGITSVAWIADHFVNHENALFALLWDSAAPHTYDSTDKGVTWVANADVTGPVAPAEPDHHCLISVGDDAAQSDLYWAFYDDSTGLIALLKSTNDAGNWTALFTTLQSGGLNSLNWFEVTGVDDAGQYPHIGTHEGVWIGKSAPRLAVDFQSTSHEDNCSKMAVWQNRLAAPTLDDMILLETNGTTTPMGPSSKDGLPEDYRGQITAVFADRFHLFAAIDATYPGIYRYDGIGWHPVWVSTESGVGPITSLHCGGVDGTPTMFFSLGADSHWRIPNFHANPLEVTGAEWEEEAFILYSIFGGELEEYATGYWEIGMYAHALEDDSEVIDVAYQKDEDGEWRHLGTINRTTRSLELGIEADTIQLRLTLKRRASSYGYTPVVEFPSVEFYHSPRALANMAFEIDIGETEAKYNRYNVMDEVREHQATNSLLSLSYAGLPQATVFRQNVEITESPVDKKARYTLVRVK